MKASDPIPINVPYAVDYAERVPLLETFKNILLSHQKVKAGFSSKLFGENPTLYAAECGVYKGNGLVACLLIAKKLNAKVHFTALDTFAGLPDISERDREFAPVDSLYLTKKMFANTSATAVRNLLNEKGISEKSYTLVKGLFKDTLPTLPERKYFFVNIDCDLYEPHLECLEYFYPKMIHGGVMFFDDYHSPTYPMAKKAIDGFLADKKEQLFHVRFGPEADNHTKAYIVKI